MLSIGSASKALALGSDHAFASRGTHNQAAAGEHIVR
jgi:hypothetical protein